MPLLALPCQACVFCAFRINGIPTAPWKVLRLFCSRLWQWECANSSDPCDRAAIQGRLCCWSGGRTLSLQVVWQGLHSQSGSYRTAANEANHNAICKLNSTTLHHDFRHMRHMPFAWEHENLDLPSGRAATSRDPCLAPTHLRTTGLFFGCRSGFSATGAVLSMHGKASWLCASAERRPPGCRR